MSNFPLEIVRLLFRWSIYFINNIMSRTFVLVPILDEFTYGAIKYKYSQSREFNSRRLKALAWSPSVLCVQLGIFAVKPKINRFRSGYW